MIPQKMAKISNIIGTHLLSGGSQLFRRLSTAAAVARSPVNFRVIEWQNLYRRLSALGSTGGKVSDVLHQLTREGKHFQKSDLVGCLKSLRKYGRYQHCLEILEWMEKGRIDYSDRDYALRLDITHKLNGIDKAENYFNTLPPSAKNLYTYGSLLNCYCTEMMTDKALALFKTMDKMNYASNVLAFNNLMSLSMKEGHPEKVPPLVQEMKKRNIPLSNYTFCIWIQSCGFLNDLEGIEQILKEVENHTFIKNDWRLYSNLAVVYMKASQSEKAELALKKLEEVMDTSKYPDRLAYHYLISLYANAGSLESVNRIWNKLKSKLQACHNGSYLIMLKALSKLDDIEGLKKCFEEWELSHQSYDIRLPNLVINAYLRHDMLEEAELLLKEASDKGGKKIPSAHVAFATYYLGKSKIDLAMRNLETAIEYEWRPVKDRVEPFFEYFKREKDVDGAEELCRVLNEALSLDSTMYLWLLQVYAAAGKTAPDMRQRMKDDGVSVGTEHEELLMKVCPN